MFYDVVCPDSFNAHNNWKSLFNQTSHIEGKTYADLVNMKISTYVLPYHAHSYSITSVLPMLYDLCQADSTKCYMDSYAEFAWKDWQTILADKATSETEFMNAWGKKVADAFPGVSASDVANVINSSKDKYQSDYRTREDFKYGSSVGVSGTPSAIINGVKLDEVPETAEDWKALIA